MALYGLLGGSDTDPYDLYGDILTAKQREALRARSSDQTWANAANFLAKAAMPTNKKIPLGGLLAGLAGAMGGSNQDEAALTALKGGEITAKIAKLRREQRLLDELDPIQKEFLRRRMAQYASGGGVSPPAGAAPPATSAQPASGAPPAGTPPPMIVPPQPPVPEGGLLGLPPGATTSLPPMTQLAGLLGPGAYGGGGDDMSGGGIWSELASLYGGGANGTPPFDLASLGTSQGLPDLGPVQVEPLSGEARPAGGRPAPDDRSDAAWEYYKPIIKKYESGGRNIEQGVVGPQGGYNPSTRTVTGPSSASGYLQMINPTWRAAAARAGIDTTQFPRAINAPEDVQDEAGKALFKEQGLAPWAPYNRNLAQAVGWTGRSANSGLPDAGRVRIEPLGGEAAPAGGSGLIPGLGVAPEELAILNSMYEAAGVDAPFKSLLETYYKSPGYLGEAATVQERAKIAEQEPFQRRQKLLELQHNMREKGLILDLATGEIKEDPQFSAISNRRTEQTEELKLGFSKKLKQFEVEQKIAEEVRLDQREPVTAFVYGPGGAILEKQMLRGEQVKRLQQQSMTPGDYKEGDIVTKPLATAPAEHEFRMTPQGRLSVVPLSGSPAAQKAVETAEKRAEAQYQMLQSRDIVVGNVDRIEQIMESAILPTTGAAGSWLSGIGGTAAKNIHARVETLKARLSIDEINRIRNSNPTGAAFGNLSNQEGDKVAAAQVALDQAQTEDEFRDALRTAKQIYIDATTRARLPEYPVLKVPGRTGGTAPGATAAPTTPIDKATYDRLPSGSVYTAPDGSRRTKP